MGRDTQRDLLSSTRTLFCAKTFVPPSGVMPFYRKETTYDIEPNPVAPANLKNLRFCMTDARRCSDAANSRRTDDNPGFHEWTGWRTKLNDALIKLIKERNSILGSDTPDGGHHHLENRKHLPESLTEPVFTIERELSDFALSQRRDSFSDRDGAAVFNLGEEAFVTFGLPRVQRVSSLSEYPACPTPRNTPTTPTPNDSPSGDSENGQNSTDDNIGPFQRHYDGGTRNHAIVFSSSRCDQSAHDRFSKKGRVQSTESLSAVMELSEEEDEY